MRALSPSEVKQRSRDGASPNCANLLVRWVVVVCKNLHVARPMRDAQVAGLRRALTENAAVAVVGEPGIGKTTRLMQAIGSTPHLLGQSLPLLSTTAYAPLSHAVHHWLRGTPDDIVAEVTGRLGERLLVIEDLQWADDQTIAVVARLVGRSRLVLTARDRSALPDVPALTIIEIEPLSDQAAASVMRKLHPQLDASRRSKLVAAADGNPLLLKALVLDGDVSPTLAAALTTRLAHLTPEDRDTFGRLALHGGAAPTRIVGSLSQPSSSSLAVSDGTTIRFLHPLISETMLTLLSEAEEARLRRQLVPCVDDARAAHHLLALGSDAEAADRAECAAATAAQPDRAELLALAVRARGSSAPNRLRLSAAAALLEASRTNDADDVAAAVDNSNPSETAEALLYRSQAAWLHGDRIAAAEYCAQGLSVAPESDPVHTVLVIEQASQAVRTRVGDPSLVDAARVALALAESSGQQVSKAHSVLGLALAHTGQDGWDEQYRRSAALAKAEGDIEQELASTYWLASALGLYGPILAAAEIEQGMLTRTRQLGALRWHSHFLGAYAMHAFGTGTAGDDLIPEVRSLLATDPLFRNRSQVDLALAIGLIDRGEFDAATSVLDVGRAFIRNDEDRSLICIAACELAWSTDDWQALELTLTELATCERGFFAINAMAESATIYLSLQHGRAPTIPRYPTTVMRVVDVVATEHEAFDRWIAGDSDGAITTFVEAATEWTHRGFLRFAGRAHLGAAIVARLSRADAVECHLAAAEAAVKGRAAVPLRAAIERERAACAMAAVRAQLTAREFETLSLVADGCTTADIAARLGVGESTVESHIRSARNKLGARSRAHAASMLPGAMHTKPPVALVLTSGSTAGVTGPMVELSSIDDEEFELTAVTVLAAVTDDRSAAATLRAAQRGARLAVDVRLAEPHRSRFIEQLARLATLQLDSTEQLSADHIALLDLLRGGSTLTQAAKTLFISRRTADRRLREIRAILGVETTTEALRAHAS